MLSALVEAHTLMARVTPCPNCGGQVEFKAGASLLSVCPYCASAVARIGDDITELELLGKVAPLADIGSPLIVGSPGRWNKKGFQLVGRVQLDYGEGPWNEWYAAFDDGTWGWVAEAQGRVYLSFGRDVGGLPQFDAAGPGTRFKAGNKEMVVVERRAAKFVSAEGELPFAVEPGSEFRYADAQGPDGAFGTIDYGDDNTPDQFFYGREFQYEDLFDRSILRDITPAAAAAAIGLNCPNCGSGVDVRAPDESQRVACGTCGSVLDCTKGNELYLLQAAKHAGPDPLIPLGSKGTFNGKTWITYGFVTRGVTYDGMTYSWNEYLLRGDPTGGYRWLVESDGHWTWVDPVAAPDVQHAIGKSARYKDTNFRLFTSASARVMSLRGEFYWKVAVGERVGTMDFVAPPQVLSQEVAADEVNWSQGTYLEPSAVQAAFRKMKLNLPRPHGVAPHQPNPHKASLKGMMLLGVAFTALLVLLAMVMAAASDNHVVLEQRYTLESAALVVPGAKKTTTPVRRTTGKRFSTREFVMPDTDNLTFTMSTGHSSGWTFFSGKLINTLDNSQRPVGVLTRTRAARTVMLGTVKSGTYRLEMLPEWSGTKSPEYVDVKLTRDVFTGGRAVWMFFLIWLLPLIQAMRYYGFEKRRWADSDV